MKYRRKKFTYPENGHVTDVAEYSIKRFARGVIAGKKIKTAFKEVLP